MSDVSHDSARQDNNAVRDEHQLRLDVIQATTWAILDCDGRVVLIAASDRGQHPRIGIADL